jgi:hypothetical protein
MRDLQLGEGTMHRWLAKLQGEQLDLEEFPKWFPSGQLHAVEENGEVFIAGSDLDAIMDGEVALKTATDALNEFSAVISLLWPSLRKPTIGQMVREDDTGQRHIYSFATGLAAGRSKLSAVAVNTGGSTTTQAQDWLSAARDSLHLAAAVRLWGDPIRSWGRLYRIMEEIERHFGKQVDHVHLCSNGERTRFTRTANTAEVAGADSRHGLGKFVPPDKPMSLHEATCFVSGLLSGALRGR